MNFKLGLGIFWLAHPSFCRPFDFNFFSEEAGEWRDGAGLYHRLCRMCVVYFGIYI
jgi:hypothetical protein